MLSEKTLFHLRKSALPFCIALSVALLSPPVLHSAEERSYAHEIQQYVAEDKVYLLENIRQNATRSSEKTVLDALFCEDGPQAMALYQKQLRDYPDPALDQLSTSRIAAYNLALDSTAPLPKLSRPLPSDQPRISGVQDSIRPQLPARPKKPALQTFAVHTPEKPKRETTKAVSISADKNKEPSSKTKEATFTVQFGSFGNRENAQKLANKISLYEPTVIVSENGMYKVRLKRNFASQNDAADAAKKLPFNAIVVPDM